MQVLLLMATALDLPISRQIPQAEVVTLATELRSRQQCIAEITEMIHVSDLCVILLLLVIKMYVTGFAFVLILYDVTKPNDLNVFILYIPLFILPSHDTVT